MERLYFDAVAFIYYIEQRAPWYARIDARLAASPVQIVVSDLTRMESRVKPIAVGNTALLAEFDAAFAVVELAPLTAAVFDRRPTSAPLSSSKPRTPSTSPPRSKPDAMSFTPTTTASTRSPASPSR